MSVNYNDDSIRQLKGAERLRLRPEAMLGSRNLDGAKHTVLEIIGNATDEKLAGFGTDIDVYLHEDDSITIRDYGRGVPLGWNEKEGNWNYFLIYEELYAGGKYDNNQEILKKIQEENRWNGLRIEDYPYLITIGLNGLGAASTQFTSEFFEVTSYRRGVASTMKYKDGIHILDELLIEDTDEPDGTKIHWKADSRVFTDVRIPSKWFERLCHSLSYISGFNVKFYNKGVLKEYPRVDMSEVMSEATGNCIKCSNFIHTLDGVGDICICQADIAIGSDGRRNEFYHNMVEVSGGAHSDGYNTALWTFFNDISREYGVKLRESDYAGKFSVIISTLANKMSPRGQTKDSIDDAYVGNCICDAIYNSLREEYQKGTEWVQKAVEETITNARNRIAVAEMSKNLREIERSTKRYKVSDKFVSCISYKNGNAKETELFIVEGDSAGGRVNTARDSRFQCFLQIRGKSLNVYKATIEKLLANKEIKDLNAALGCGAELGIEGYESFDISKLKVGKVFFLTDADIDGKHIAALLFLIFWKLYPELLYQGYVYIVDTPLYVMNLKDNTCVYCMSEEELAEKRKELGGQVRSIDRFKGLGETDSDTLWETTLNPENRVVHQIKLDRNDTEVYDVLEVLFGKSTEKRKKAILGSMLGSDFDEVIEEMISVADYIDSLDLNQVEVEEVEYA